MIVQDARSKKQTRLASLFLSTLAIGLLIGSIAYLFISTNEGPKLGPDLILCDAEKVHASSFVKDGVQFSKGVLQSSDFSKSGNYSCKVEKGEGIQYGFSYSLDQLVPGTIYKASVWRLKNIYNRGNLVVQATGEGAYYKSQDTPLRIATDGWELLEIRFFVPFGKKLDAINIHVFTDGSQTVYFDDLRIEKIQQWEAEAFTPSILDINISEEAMEQLRKKRAIALAEGILESSDKDWVPAEIVDENKAIIPIKMRLKGDWLDHLKANKWSFRIKTAPSYSWNRMKTFSLHTPTARYYLQEWLLHKLWERENVLSPRYDFIELRLNGETLGIYAYEEHFEKQLLEYKQRREGPILKLSEDGYWSGIKRQLQEHGYIKPDAAHSAMQAEHADIQAFKEQRLRDNPVLEQQLTQAKNLVAQFKEGSTSTKTLFDIELLARYYAICDVMNAYHGIAWHNQRFYYNPVINKLEPIGFDGYGEKPDHQLTIKGQGALHPTLLEDENLFSRLFMDEDFVAAYVKNLHRISSKAYFQEFIDSIYPEWQPRLEWLQLEFPHFKVTLDDISRNASFVHSLLLPFNGQSLKTYSKSLKEGTRTVLLKNTHLLPIEIIGVGLNKKKVSQLWDTPIILPGQKTRLMQARLNKDTSGKILDFGRLRFQEAVALDNQQLFWFQEVQLSAYAKSIFYRPLGLDTIFYATISEQTVPQAFNNSPDIFEAITLTSNAVFQVEGQQVLFKKGRHVIKEDIIIPKGYRVHFEAGVQLDFTENAGFISRSPVQLFGTEEDPVKILSNDQTGSGFTILQTSEPSNLNYVIFDGLNTLRKKEWTLTGAVNFYEAEVNINRTVFKNSPCEDALNLIRSTFELNYCRFFNIAYDAFDSDFCKGSISNSYFYQVGNDAMDFSGSLVNLKSCQIKECGDKGISVGEESDANVFDTSIEACPIAVASKDLSVLYINDIFIKDCDQGFVAFQKKAEFGGSQIVVKQFEAENIKRLHAISAGCSLQLKDKLIKN